MDEKRRLEFHERLCEVLESRNVYFQPPEDLRLRYPAIVYSYEQINNKYANNGVYVQFDGYKVTLIDEDPDSKYAAKLSKLPTSRPGQPYKADNLNHFPFTIHH